MLYLTAVKQYPLYGGTFFDVQFKGFWAYPNRFVWLLWVCRPLSLAVPHSPRCVITKMCSLRPI